LSFSITDPGEFFTAEQLTRAARIKTYGKLGQIAPENRQNYTFHKLLIYNLLPMCYLEDPERPAEDRGIFYHGVRILRIRTAERLGGEKNSCRDLVLSAIGCRVAKSIVHLS
jgi:hypothetical protein